MAYRLELRSNFLRLVQHRGKSLLSYFLCMKLGIYVEYYKICQ
nr:MAG TPA: hypothetical protein [Caudoviricetes sp.]